jgi:hypothetical protein
MYLPSIIQLVHCKFAYYINNKALRLVVLVVTLYIFPAADYSLYCQQLPAVSLLPVVAQYFKLILFQTPCTSLMTSTMQLLAQSYIALRLLLSPGCLAQRTFQFSVEPRRGVIYLCSISLSQSQNDSPDKKKDLLLEPTAKAK